jgi:hypothetical protein
MCGSPGRAPSQQSGSTPIHIALLPIARPTLILRIVRVEQRQVCQNWQHNEIGADLGRRSVAKKGKLDNEGSLK